MEARKKQKKMTDITQHANPSEIETDNEMADNQHEVGESFQETAIRNSRTTDRVLGPSEKDKERFYQNEKDFFPVTCRMKVAIRLKDEDAAIKPFAEFESLVPSITPLFIEEHQIDKLLKETRMPFADDGLLVIE